MVRGIIGSMAVEIEWMDETPERRREIEVEIRRLARRFAELGAELVVLFGSRAEGTSNRNSDIDLLVVMPCDTGRSLAGRFAEIGEMVDPRYATDLLVYTPEEFENLRRTNRFVSDVLRRGRVLFEKKKLAQGSSNDAGHGQDT